MLVARASRQVVPKPGQPFTQCIWCNSERRSNFSTRIAEPCLAENLAIVWPELNEDVAKLGTGFDHRVRIKSLIRGVFREK